MKRIRTIVVFLLLGAVVNVAVAWGCAILLDLRLQTWSPSFSGYSLGKLASGHDWFVFANERRGGAIIGSVVESPGRPSFGQAISRRLADEAPSLRVPIWCRAEIPEFNPVEDSIQVQVVEGFGWPWLSLRVSFRNVRLLGTMQTKALAVERWTGLAVSSDASMFRPPRALPLVPIWPSFAINTIFYTTILWSLTLGPFAVRRMIRRKRGHCIKCGYDLRGEFSAGCPECGWRRETGA